MAHAVRLRGWGVVVQAGSKSAHHRFASEILGMLSLLLLLENDFRVACSCFAISHGALLTVPG